MYRIIFDDNLKFLLDYNKKDISLIYIDPPFFTNKFQKRGSISYNDKFFSLDDYLYFLKERVYLTTDILKENGSFFIHVNWRTVHYVKVMLDEIFGYNNFMNEIIWSYDYGGIPKKYWPRKHDNILWYVMDRNNYIFNYEEMDRIPYMAPGLVGKEKAIRGKTPTDVWWHTIVPTNGKEKTGYPTQKPLGILERIVKVHSNPGDLLLDFFAGSGSFGEAAIKNNRDVILVDNNPQAIEIMERRLSKYAR